MYPRQKSELGTGAFVNYRLYVVLEGWKPARVVLPGLEMTAQGWPAPLAP